jgi:hypothetical protein
MRHQPAFGGGHVGGRDAGGQHVDGVAYDADVLLADRAGGHRGGQLGQLRGQRRAGQRAPRPDPGGQLEPAEDLPRRQVQPRPQHVAHRRDGFAAIGGLGDLVEEPIYQPPVGALLGLEPLGHPHPKPIAHHIRVGLPQHRMRGVDGIQGSTNALPRLLATTIHAPNAKSGTVITAPPAAGLWTNTQLWIPGPWRGGRRARAFLAGCPLDVPV